MVQLYSFRISFIFYQEYVYVFIDKKSKAFMDTSYVNK